MQRRDHQVTGFRSLHCRLDRLGVAHFTNEDHIGILTQRRAETDAKTLGVHPHFPLRHRTLQVAVHMFNGVLQREDVLLMGIINGVHHRRHGTRLPGARHTSYQHHAALRLGNALQHGW